MWVFVVALIVISKYNTKRLDLIYIQIVTLLIRNILTMLDFEEKRFDEKRNISVFIVLQLQGINILGISLSFLMTNKIKIFILQTLSASFSVLGAFIMQEKMRGSFREMTEKIIETNASNSMLMGFTTLAGSLILHYLLNFGQIEILKAQHSKKLV
jgi:hypothetical protein